MYYPDPPKDWTFDFICKWAIDLGETTHFTYFSLYAYITVPEARAPCSQKAAVIWFPPPHVLYTSESRPVTHGSRRLLGFWGKCWEELLKDVAFWPTFPFGCSDQPSTTSPDAQFYQTWSTEPVPASSDDAWDQRRPQVLSWPHLHHQGVHAWSARGQPGVGGEQAEGEGPFNLYGDGGAGSTNWNYVQFKS